MNHAYADNSKDDFLTRLRRWDIVSPAGIWKRVIFLFVAAIFWSVFTTSTATAYTVVTVSTGAPVGLEAQFLASTTTQYQAVLFTNPLFGSTYQITLFGLNPNFNPPVTNLELLQSLVTVDSTTYVYGFADGMTYQQTQEESLVGFMGNLCGYATNYNLVQTSTGTFNKATCSDVVGTIEKCLFEESLSTPTVIPPEP